ncbi:nucleoside phosphorylase domain-containing protein [Aspergillus egyptiacus]|nr:nucleoside phosphorylase domain-containing protein [Aspergillus egyptiacus]
MTIPQQHSPSPVPTQTLDLSAYTVGWICALNFEYFAALRMLDEEHNSNGLNLATGDGNNYTLGRIGEHNVVINCPPAGTYGQIRAIEAVTGMRSTFPWIRFVLLVGIGGGVPSKQDIRLGDVVVGTRVIPIDSGKRTDFGFQVTGQHASPPKVLLTAVTKLQANLESKCLSQSIEAAAASIRNRWFSFSRPEQDRLHSNEAKPFRGRLSSISRRDYREGDLSAVERDNLAAQENLICFEMEAAGVMHEHPCLPIRGISDYADGNKDDTWQPYAALAAAVYARELLRSMPKYLVSRCLISVPGDELRRFVDGAVSSASKFFTQPSSPGNNVIQTSHDINNSLKQCHDLIQELIPQEVGKLEELKAQSQTDKLQEVQDKVKSLERFSQLLNETVNDLSHRLDKPPPDYVTREEWEGLRREVKENSSRIASLSTATHKALGTTSELLVDLSERTGNKDLGLAAAVLGYSRSYMEPLTALGRNLRGSRTPGSDRSKSPAPGTKDASEDTSKPGFGLKFVNPLNKWRNRQDTELPEEASIKPRTASPIPTTTISTAAGTRPPHQSAVPFVISTYPPRSVSPSACKKNRTSDQKRGEFSHHESKFRITWTIGIF